MNLSVGTNFDNNLIEGIKGTAVKSIYGKLPNDSFGGGRPSFCLPNISEGDLKRHINLAHENNIEFNYLLNATCLDNLEYTKSFNKEIFKTIEWLANMGVDTVTVAIPYLIEVIKKIAPNIKVSLSTFSYVDSLQKALEYEKLGVDIITMPEVTNRNFKLLEKITKNISCKIQLIATNPCMVDCPYRMYHYNTQSHGSQNGHVSKGVTFDYCLLKCTRNMLQEPVELIKSRWIRPDDISVYEEIGIHDFKITERMKTTERITSICKAYTAQKYSGDLGRLLSLRVKEDFLKPQKLPSSNDYNMKYIYESRDVLFKGGLKIDNSKLDGFIDFFKKKENDCLNTLCGVECRHCYNYAEKALNYDEEKNKNAVEEISNLLDKVTTGSIFKDESNEENYEWNKEIITKLNDFLEKKPDFIREQAQTLIMKKSEEIAKKDNRNKISISDLLIANYLNTPEQFQYSLRNELEQLGIDVQKLK